MHGYAAAWILKPGMALSDSKAEVITQKSQSYAVITIKNPSQAPFTMIPNAYKTLMAYMQMNGIRHKEDKEILPCFEKEYRIGEIGYMDVYIAVK